jgi:RNA polymerase sigma-70 factor (ECF subfamily)
MSEQEYNKCVDMYADNVYRFILKTMGNREDARDVVQSAFEKLWLNRASVFMEKSRAYLFTIAYNQMIDQYRKAGRIRLAGSLPENAAITEQPQAQMKRNLEEALARLNDTQRSLVLLKDYEGYSYAEIGEITGLNESQVKVYLHRARLQLRNYLVRPENIR